MTIYHLILEATLGLTTFEFSTRFLQREGLLPGFVAGYTKIHHDEHRHIGYGVGPDVSGLGASADELRGFALDGLTRRLKIVGVPLDTL